MTLYQLKDVADRQPGVCAQIIPFMAKPAPAGLSMRDRMEISAWRGQLRAFGYDRVVIHERIACDAPEVDSFLSIYRQGEAWARWNLARCGASILAWCSVTGTDVGRFGSMREAMLALFPVAPGEDHPSASAVVIRAFC
jgi:hypothetical protein